MSHPPKSGKRAGIMLPAPAMPVYNARLEVPDTSSNTPFRVIPKRAKTTPPVRKTRKNGGWCGKRSIIPGKVTARNVLIYRR